MFRALNENKRDEDDSTRAQDGSFKKPTKEAQEEEAMDTYNQAMALFAQSKYEEAAQSFLDLLQGQYLNQVNSTPKQMQLRLGCYKNLSKIYSSMKEPDYETSKSFLHQAIEAEPNNTNLWYQLGQIGMLMIDFSLATSGFSQALRCAPGHWGCIEKLIETSYITDDYIGCLHYCAMGIGKDESFIRGHVFRDIIFENHPFYKELVQKRIENPEQLSIKYNGDYNFEEVKEKYLLEIDQLKCKEKKIILENKNIEEEERSRPFLNQTCSLNTKSLSALVQNLLLLNEAVKEYGTFLRPVILENDVGQCEKKNEITKDFSSTCTVDFNDSKNQNLPTSINEKQQKQKESDTGSVPIGNNNDDYNQEEKPKDDVKNENEAASRKKKFKKDWKNEGKRRSQRVKGIVSPLCNDFDLVKRKEEEEVFSEALKSIIHSSFFYVESSSEKGEDVDAEPFESNISKVYEADNYFSSLNEEMDVKNFVQENTNDNIINIINNFLAFLCNEKGDLAWPEELANGFIHLYQVYRSHTMLPDISYNKDLPAFTLDTRITLTFLELVVDNFFSESESVKKSSNEFQVQIPADTLHHLNEIIQANQDNVEYQNLIIRLYWAQSNLLFTLEKKYEKSGNHQVIIEYLQASLELFKKFGLTTSIKLSTRKDNTISLPEIVQKISCVEKFRNIDHVHDLYSNKKFAELIEILNYSQTSIHQVKHDELKLVHQFYLAESYFQLNQYHEAITQCVKVLKCSLTNYQITSKCLSIIDSILQIYMGNMSLVEHKMITNQLVQVLITYAGKLVLGRSSLYTLPWCILHRIISYYELTDPSIYLTTAAESEDTPSSIKLLQFAHETLSSKNKCLIDDGALLKYTIEKVNLCPDSYFDFKETKQTVEQAIYCLYNHPQKKKRSRYLVEHSTSGLSCNLAWENYKDVYLYYKPAKLPEFDSYAQEFISSDVATLYQRILSLIPQVYKPTEGEIRAVLHFLDGKVDNIENEHRRDSSTTFPQDFQDIYYLIANYYWMTKEWKKVVEYSVSDLTFNPRRFDSFIFVAMAKWVVLSEQFNFCRKYNPEDVLETSGQIAKCYEKALMLDPGNSKIVLEFGSFSYGVHSFCSRLTKQSSVELSMDKFTFIDSKKDEFLQKAKECFEHFHRTTTEEIYIDEDDEELWFQHYMLGKIEEKLNLSDPAIYLSQYELAGSLLHQLDKNHKSCPNKINYSNPPDLAIETLEIYYRLHASILAYIERHDYCEEKENLLAEFIERASQTPFVLGRSTDCDSKKSETEDNGLIVKELLENIIDRVVIMDVETCSNSSLMEMESQNQNSSSIINSQSKLSLSQMSTNSNIERYQSGSIQMKETVQTFEERKFYEDFKDVKYGRLVAKCLQAIELCISRFPQHYKSYYRIAFTYSNMLKNYSMSRVYYFGRFQDPCNQERKIDGLFYDRKQNNIFNNIRRNPVEDIDRLGSLSYHMAKAIHHAIDILHHLEDCNLLNEIGELLSKEPESNQKYIYCNERQELRDLAFSFSKSIKKSLPTTNVGQAEENEFGCEQKQRQNINNLQVQSSAAIRPANKNPIPNSNISTKISSTRQISTDGTWMSNTSTSTTMADRNNTNSLNTRKEIPAQKTSLSLSLNKNKRAKPVSSMQEHDNKVVAKSGNEINIQDNVPTKTSISNIDNKTKNLISITTTSATISAASNSPYISLKSPPRTQNNDSREKNSPEIIDLTCKTPPKDPLEIEIQPKDPLKIETPPKGPLEIDTPPKDPLKMDTPPKYRRIIDTHVKRVPILDKRILELQKRARERELCEPEYQKILKSLNSSMQTDDPKPKPLPNLIAIPGAANLSSLSRNKKNGLQMKESSAGNLNKNNVERRVSLKRKVKASKESEESSLSPPKNKQLKLSKDIVSNNNSTSISSSSISHSSTLSTTSSVSQSPGFMFQDPSNPEKFIIKPEIIIIDD